MSVRGFALAALIILMAGCADASPAPSVTAMSDATAICDGSLMADCPNQVSRMAAESPGGLIAVCNYADGSGSIAVVEDAADPWECSGSAAGVETDVVRVVRLSRTASFAPYAEATPPVVTAELRNPEIGVEYEYITFTHCGFTGIVVDGEWWPPAGEPRIGRDDKFDFSMDRGTVVLTDSTHATYTSSKGYVVQVGPWEGPLPSLGICM